MIGDNNHLRTVDIDEQFLNPAAVLQFEFDPFDKCQSLLEDWPDTKIKAFFIIEEDGVGTDFESVDGDAFVG